MKTKLKQGFTLIELMIVIAIIAILAAIAVPAYQNYTNRTQTAEAYTLASSAKTAIGDVVQSNGGTAAALAAVNTNAAAGLGLPATISGKYTSAVSIGTGAVITATMGNQASSAIAGDVVTLSPSVPSTGSPISWTCNFTGPAGVKPASCN